MKSPRPFCIHACIYNSKCKTWIYFSNLIKSYKHNSRSVEFTTKGCRRRIITQVFQFRLYLAYCANNNKPTLAHILTICILSFYTYTYNTASIFIFEKYIVIMRHNVYTIHILYVLKVFSIISFIWKYYISEHFLFHHIQKYIIILPVDFKSRTF